MDQTAMAMDKTLAHEREQEAFVSQAVDAGKRQFQKTGKTRVHRDNDSDAIFVTVVATGRRLMLTDKDLLVGERAGTEAGIRGWVRQRVG